ncbi:hypothetical protein WSK_3021 [Novosphingobium sp. Rr 2-17]|uniref:GIN domain-containing protein n=1 Tax=Novosphingobium sp. Rr 2-17 TaxID=555793 RepID=UPI000269AB79|nr:DUF2807 domain-containing protein [Novosphingobium sp. Rr 2-17]EIZ78402.1 hypothetical protein WSK_3021 [Novosphingobium sp. Rr 2-17]
MLRKLLIVFASGVILSIVAFGSAWLVGGDRARQEFEQRNGWNWTFGDDDDDAAQHGPRKTRSFPVVSGSQIAMEIPVELDFVKGDKSEMTVEGPASVVDRLVWTNGRLSIQGKSVKHGIKVHITAPEIAGLDLDAPGDITMTGLDQQKLYLNSNAAISLDASGKVQQVFVDTRGAGDIDLGKLEAKDATVHVRGVGDVTLGATGTVNVEINGAGNVSLVRKPATLQSRINGVGSIDHDY